MAANELEEILGEFMNTWGNYFEPYEKTAKDNMRHDLLSLIESEKVKARIEELERLRGKEQVFVGYGYDEVGVDSDHIGKRLAELKEGGTEQ